VPEPDIFSSEITIWVSGDISKILPSKNVISAVESPPDLIVSPALRSIPAAPEIQALVPDRINKISPLETEKMVTGTIDVVVTVVVVDDVVVDWVGVTDVDTAGVFVVVVVVTGREEVVVVAGGSVLCAQANTLVRSKTDRVNIIITLPDTDLFIFI
jgi:hypothetical protein